MVYIKMGKFMNAMKTILIILMMGFLMVFAIENTQSLTQMVYLRLNFGIKNYSFPPLPLYTLILLPFCGGILFMAILMMAKNFQWKRRIKDKDRTIKVLQEELNSLKGLSAKPKEISQAMPAETTIKDSEDLSSLSKEKKSSALKQIASWIKEKF